MCKGVCAVSAQNASTALVPSVNCETENDASSAYTTCCTVEESTPSSSWISHHDGHKNGGCRKADIAVVVAKCDVKTGVV